MRTLFLCILIAVALGCGKSEDKPADKPVDKPLNANKTPKPKDKPATEQPPPARAQVKVTLKDGAGAKAFVIIPRKDGAKIVGAKGDKIARFKTRGDTSKIQGKNEQELGFVTGAADKITLKSPDMAIEQYILTRQDDGTYQVKDGTGVGLYVVKKHAEGMEVRDASDAVIYQVTVKEGSVSLHKPDGTAVYSTDAPVHPASMACLGFEQLTLSQRFAMFWQVQQTAK